MDIIIWTVYFPSRKRHSWRSHLDARRHQPRARHTQVSLVVPSCHQPRDETANKKLDIISNNERLSVHTSCQYRKIQRELYQERKGGRKVVVQVRGNWKRSVTVFGNVLNATYSKKKGEKKGTWILALLCKNTMKTAINRKERWEKKKRDRSGIVFNS